MKTLAMILGFTAALLVLVVGGLVGGEAYDNAMRPAHIAAQVRQRCEDNIRHDLTVAAKKMQRAGELSPSPWQLGGVIGLAVREQVAEECD